MFNFLNQRPAGLAFWIVLLGLCPSPGAAQLEASRVAWSRLEFKASKLAISAYSEVELEFAPASAASAELITPGENREGLAPRGAESLLLKLRTRVLGQESQVRFWFDPSSAVAYQRSELSTSNQRYKTYRYTREGVFSLARKPAKGEVDLPHETSGHGRGPGAFDAGRLSLPHPLGLAARAGRHAPFGAADHDGQDRPRGPGGDALAGAAPGKRPRDLRPRRE